MYLKDRLSMAASGKPTKSPSGIKKHSTSATKVLLGIYPVIPKEPQNLLEREENFRKILEML